MWVTIGIKCGALLSVRCDDCLWFENHQNDRTCASKSICRKDDTWPTQRQVACCLVYSIWGLSLQFYVTLKRVQRVLRENEWMNGWILQDHPTTNIYAYETLNTWYSAWRWSTLIHCELLSAVTIKAPQSCLFLHNQRFSRFEIEIGMAEFINIYITPWTIKNFTNEIFHFDHVQKILQLPL